MKARLFRLERLLRETDEIEVEIPDGASESQIELCVGLAANRLPESAWTQDRKVVSQEWEEDEFEVLPEDSEC